MFLNDLVNYDGYLKQLLLNCANADSEESVLLCLEELSNREITGILVSQEGMPLWNEWTEFVYHAIALSNYSPSLGVLYVMRSVTTWMLAYRGSEKAKRMYLQGMRKGEIKGSFAIHDENGSRVTVKNIDGQDIICGRKNFVTGVHSADLLIVQITGGDGNKNIYLVPVDAPGVHIEQETWKGMGLKSQDSCSVTFESVKIEDYMIMNHVPSGLTRRSKSYGFSIHSLGFASVAVGTAMQLVRMTYEFSGKRGDSFSTQNSRILGDMTVLLDCALALVEKAATHIALDSSDCVLLCEESRIAAVKTAVDISDMCLHIGGSHFYSNCDMFHRLYNDVRGLTLLGPRASFTSSRLGKHYVQSTIPKSAKQ
ncbi:acyl-CoA dehydrogenase family protein [Alicyclobacillus fastidiosus]|uniref:acyl-CoA dehydrogenase family protein n=1 Tax=Alicyclobacillus fastidiosus TaxID=392011 RepID=UPI0023EA1C3B|nr:acyl-CoA dehydrogenase family protein [Alicyclobacillus fastidiosus]GMA66059.1 hypothetical protein GCM10025859_65010 [Alicyclobacillus fastidiosus]